MTPEQRREELQKERESKQQSVQKERERRREFLERQQTWESTYRAPAR
jgi:hypothetical protein